MAENKKTAGQLAVEAEQARQRLAEVQQQAPGAYQSGYGAQIDALLAKLDSRPGFQYDLQGDALYRQYQQQYQKQGKAAMEDTGGHGGGTDRRLWQQLCDHGGQSGLSGVFVKNAGTCAQSCMQAAYRRYQDEGSAAGKATGADEGAGEQRIQQVEGSSAAAPGSAEPRWTIGVT